MPDIQNPTKWSDFDFLEFEGFVSKVDIEGYAYAAENYRPRFEAPALQARANDDTELRALYTSYAFEVDDWKERVGGERACDLHNDHVDEVWKRREDASLFGVRCTDGHVITYETADDRDRGAAYLLENRAKGWRIPEMLLTRSVPGGEWTEERRV